MCIAACGASGAGLLGTFGAGLLGIDGVGTGLEGGIGGPRGLLGPGEEGLTKRIMGFVTGFCGTRIQRLRKGKNYNTSVTNGWI